MARIHEFLRQLRATNVGLADDIEREVDALSNRRAFGLNFERHTPEAVELPGRPVRTGDKVRVLPPRGETPKFADAKLWRVASIEGKGNERVAKVEAFPAVAPIESTSARAVDLVVVAEFRDPIYPGLVATGSVIRGGDKPFHTVINGENFHALQTLMFTHRGKVDAIYIDPPYNTGAKDWKYNNDYVESEDLYRHSKWLAFMERRLLLAKDLLNADDSVLIITIDEKEYLRLGLLLEQTFPEAKIQMVTSVINPSGSSRAELFSRSDEYIYVVLFGRGRVIPTGDDMLSDASAVPRFEVRWDSLRRRGNASRRSRIPSLFYPIYFNSETGEFHHAGEMVSVDEGTAPTISGLDYVLPVAPNGAEMTWSLSAAGFTERLSKGYVRYYRNAAGGYVIRFIQEGTIRAIKTGEVVEDGRDEHGFIKWTFVTARRMTPMTTWRRPSHSASDYGTPTLNALLPRGRRFPYPKSIYAVEDVLRFFIGEKPTSVVVDFFSGSGTTMHAVMRMNKQDGGRRICIAVTNNEVSAEEQTTLRRSGFRAGDPEWERQGICEYITKPRIRAAVTGMRDSGEKVVGDYKFTDEFPMADGLEENVTFLTLTYEASLRLRANRDFEKVAALLWMRAGSIGRRIESVPDGWSVAEAYGVIADLDKTDAFLGALATSPTATTAFIITDDDSLFGAVVADLPEGVEPVRLYDAYLRNFEIDAMRSVR
ncbi:site-specific DNA-methyltransferase [Cryobacterium sp. Y50]|uniref:site-specific DNA-methyltransferase n=1 Tax=Cryobacterium sp. Y50 TaxID=2048286 RepID=UPI000CE4DDBC|nr:DNA methyltransferase [Cryobacterium sp. Y50]